MNEQYMSASDWEALFNEAFDDAESDLPEEVEDAIGTLVEYMHENEAPNVPLRASVTSKLDQLALRTGQDEREMRDSLSTVFGDDANSSEETIDGMTMTDGIDEMADGEFSTVDDLDEADGVEMKEDEEEAINNRLNAIEDEDEHVTPDEMDEKLEEALQRNRELTEHFDHEDYGDE